MIELSTRAQPYIGFYLFLENADRLPFIALPRVHMSLRIHSHNPTEPDKTCGACHKA